MLESLPLILGQYGFFGLFFASFLGSTIFFPVTIEPLIGLLVPYLNLYLIVLVATIGSSLGTCVNYGLGFLGARFIQKRITPERIKRARKLTNKYGWPGLLFIIALPFPGLPVDPITIFPGIARMNFYEFVIVIFFGKLIKYSLFVGLFKGLLNIL